MCIIEDYDNKMSYLKQMFPSKGEPEISKALMDVKGDQETAFDILMGAGRYKWALSLTSVPTRSPTDLVVRQRL